MLRSWMGFCLSFLCLLPLGSATSAEPDCNGFAPDGTPKCVPVQISEFRYDGCAANSLSYVIGAENYCAGLHYPLTSEGKLIDWVNCVYTRLNGSGRTYVTPPVPWAASGSDPDSAFQCYHTEVVHKFGVEMRGWARYDRYWPRIYVTRQRSASCPSGYSPFGSSQGYPDYCVRSGGQTGTPPGCPEGTTLNPATNRCEVAADNELGPPDCGMAEGQG